MSKKIIKCGIYKIVNKINGKYYAGSSDCIFRRWSEHSRALKRKFHYNKHLQQSWNKYGEKNFEFIIIEECLVDQLLIVEQKYLDIAKQEKEKCYNQSFIAGRPEMTEEVRKKIGEGNKGKLGYWTGKPRSKETKRKIKENHLNFCGKNNPMFGKRHSKEAIRKIRTKCSGTNHSGYDDTIYKFYNKSTNETFVGTRYGFYKKYNLYRSRIYDLVNKIRKHVKNWIIV